MTQKPFKICRLLSRVIEFAFQMLVRFAVMPRTSFSRLKSREGE